MKRIGEEQKMTVKEVAEAIGTAESTIRNKAKELYPETIENGKPTLLTEQQVYEIKKAIVPRDLTLKSKLESAGTSLDVKEITVKVIKYHMAEAERLRIVNAKQSAQLAIAAPKIESFDAMQRAENTMSITR